MSVRILGNGEQAGMRTSGKRPPRAELTSEQHQAREIWLKFRKRRGTMATICRAIGVAHQTTEKWTTVPLEHVFAVSKMLRVLPEDMRPDFFINDPLRAYKIKPLTKSLPATAKVTAQPIGRPPCDPISSAAVGATAHLSAPITGARAPTIPHPTRSPSSD